MSEQPDLFAVVESIDPMVKKRTEFLKKNKIQTFYSKNMQGECPWMAWVGDPGAQGAMDYLEANGDINVGFGESENEALFNLCNAFQFKGWKEFSFE